MEKPISFSRARKKATRLYLKEHCGIDRGSIEITPKMVVIHWTAMNSLKASFRAFDRESLSSGRGDVARGGSVNVSAHFLVGRDGTIYRLMPENWMARHVIGLNHCAIGIENVGGAGGKDDLTDAQLLANVRLVRYLKKKYSAIRHLIGHHEYRKFEKGPLWLEKDSGYRTGKSDPGDGFLSRLRSRIPSLED